MHYLWTFVDTNNSPALKMLSICLRYCVVYWTQMNRVRAEKFQKISPLTTLYSTLEPLTGYTLWRRIKLCGRVRILVTWRVICVSLLLSYPSCLPYRRHLPITVAARSKAWTVFACSNTGVLRSNPTQRICLYCGRLFCVCVVLCVGRGLATGWSPTQWVLLTVYRMKELKKWPRPNKGL
jgi:hypothetical protein